MHFHILGLSALLLPFTSATPIDLAAALQDWSIKPRQVDASATSLPIINLGYVKQQADRIETAGDISYYVFKNIRFAAPPTGNNRFRKPQPPLNQEGIVQGGSLKADKTTCSQSLNIAGVTLPPQLAGLAVGTEDCLFLDVYVPTGIKPLRPLPVVINFYGGAFVVGLKESAGNVAALYKQTGERFIYVAPNYRLGAFGWLAPEGKDKDIQSNAGLWDARAATDWVSAHIWKFGGNPLAVTAMGLSAGAGVVSNLIVSGGLPLGFQKAIIQSPGWTPEFTRAGRNILYNAFLELTNCTNSACLRAADSSVLQRASGTLSKNAEAGEYGPFSGLFPVVDGDILPDSLPNRFKSNKFHSEVTQIITSSVRWEAGIGTFPIANNTSDEEFEALVRRQYTTSEPLVQKILSLFPPQTPVDGYSSGFLRTRDFIGDVLFNCNAYYAASAYSKRGLFWTARKYIFNIPPASHGADLNYNNYGVDAASPFLELLAPILGNLPPGTGLPSSGDGESGGVLQGVTRPDLAKEHQKWITDFIAKGTVRKDWPLWKKGAEKALWMNDTQAGFGVANDYFKEQYRQKRCDILRDEIYDKAN